MLRRFSIVLSVLSVLVFSACSNTGNVDLDTPGGSGKNPLVGPAHLIQVMGADSVTAGSCNAYQLQAVDRNGVAEALDAGSGFSVTLAGTAAAYVDSACTLSAASIAASSMGNAVIYIKGNKAESISLNVSALVATTVATGTRAVAVNAATATKLALAAALSSPVNICVPVTLGVMDAFDNVSGLHPNMTVSLSAAGIATASTFSDSGCLNQVSSVSMNSGVSSAVFYVQSLSTGNLNLAAIAGGLTSANVTMGFVAGSTPRLVVNVPVGNSVSSSCVAVQVQSQRADGSALVVSGANLAVTHSVVSGVSVNQFSDINCSLALAGGISFINSGSYQTTYYVKTAQAPQAVLVASNATGYVSGQASMSWVPVPATQLQISGSPASMQANSCATAQVSLRDASGNPTFTTTNTVITMSKGTNLTQADVFASNDCSGGTVNTVMIPSCSTPGACASSATFSFRPKITGALSLTASSSGLNPSSVGVNVVNPTGAATKLVLNRLTDPVSTGTCVRYQVETRDQFNNFVDVTPALVLNAVATSSSGLAAFFGDSNCVGSINTVTVASGSHSQEFYFKDTKAENVLVTLSQGSLLVQESFAVAVGAASKLVWSGAPATASAGRCSGPVYVVQKDAFDNLTTSFVNFNLSGLSSIAFYNDSQCVTSVSFGQIVTGQSQSGAFYFSGPNTGLTTLTAHATSPSSIVTDATAAVNMTAAPALHVALSCLSAGCVAVKAGQCSPLEVSLKDNTDTLFVPVNSSVNVTMTSTSTNGTMFFSENSCTNSLPANTLTISRTANPKVIFVKNTVAESFSVSGTPAVGSAGSLAFTATAATPYRLTFDAAGSNSILSDTCAGPYTIKAQDIYGNVSPFSADAQVYFNTSTMNGSALSSNPFYADAACTDLTPKFLSGASQAQFYIKSIPAGSLVVNTATTTTAILASRSFTVTERAKLAFISGGSAISGVNYNSVTIGSTSTYAVTLKNISNGETASVQTLAALVAPFKILSSGTTCTTSAPFTLTAGQSCAINFEYKPTAAVTSNATVNVSYASTSDASARTLPLTLTGTGINPPDASVALQFSSINFGSVQSGTSSNVVSVTVTNYGGQSADSILFDNFSSPFIMTLNTCGGTLTPSSTCTIALKFSPTTAASFSANMRMSYRNVTSGTTTTVNNALSMSGVAIAPSPAFLEYEWGGIDFGYVSYGSSSSVTILVTNTGAVDATNVSIVKGTNYNTYGFTASMNTCGTTIAKGTSCFVRLGFVPPYSYRGYQLSSSMHMNYSSGSSNYQTGEFSVIGIAWY